MIPSMHTTTATLTVSATFVSGTGEVQEFRAGTARPWLATEAEAQAIAALFPKSARLRVTQVHTGDGIRWTVGLEQRLRANGTTGAANETGARRIRRFLAQAEKAGVALEWTTPWSNSYATLEAFLEDLPEG